MSKKKTDFIAYITMISACVICALVAYLFFYHGKPEPIVEDRTYYGLNQKFYNENRELLIQIAYALNENDYTNIYYSSEKFNEDPFYSDAPKIYNFEVSGSDTMPNGHFTLQDSGNIFISDEGARAITQLEKRIEAEKYKINWITKERSFSVIGGIGFKVNNIEFELTASLDSRRGIMYSDMTVDELAAYMSAYEIIPFSDKGWYSSSYIR